MAKAILTKELIDNDLLNLRRQIGGIKPQFDYVRFVKPMLDKLGYDYDFNEKSGDFTMYVADGFQVNGKPDWRYQISVTISLNGNQSSVYIFDINFGTLESYERTFERLIEQLLSLKEKYYQMLKDDADANLLSTSFIEPFLAELKLNKAEVYSAQGNSSEMVVEVPVFANVSFQTIVNTDNYQARCKELAMAVRSMPKCIVSADAKEVMFHDICEIPARRSHTSTGKIATNAWFHKSADGRLFNPNDYPRVTYNDGTNSKKWPKAPAAISDNPLYSALSEMCYVYYLEGNDLIILLNDEHYLRRDGSNHKTTCRPFVKPMFEWAGVILHDKELIYSLRMFCQASADSRFEGSGTQDFFNFIIKRLLPPGNKYSLGKYVNPYIQLGTTIGDNKVVKFSGYGNKMVKRLWYLFTNWTFFENLDKYMLQYPNLRLSYKIDNDFDGD